MAGLGVPVTGCSTVQNLFITNNKNGLSPSGVKVSDITIEGYLCYTDDNTCNSTLDICTKDSGANNTNCSTYSEY